MAAPLLAERRNEVDTPLNVVLRLAHVKRSRVAGDRGHEAAMSADP
jgi:hypothetical protein